MEDFDELQETVGAIHESPNTEEDSSAQAPQNDTPVGDSVLDNLPCQGEGDRAAVEGSAPSADTPVGDGVLDVPPNTEEDSSAQAPQNDIPEPQSDWQATAQPYAVWPPAAQAQSLSAKPKKPRRWPWILLGALIGFLLGWGGAMLAHGLQTERPQMRGEHSQTQSTPAQQGDLSGRIQAADDAAISTAPAEVYRANVDSVVGIAGESTTTNAWGQQSAVASVGTGFIISEDGYVLTNYHVVEGAGRLTVMLSDGQELEAELVGYDSDTCDIALLKIEASGLQPVTFGDSDALLVGQQVCAIGNPLGELTYTLTVGYVSAKDRIINSDGTPINMLQTDCTINSGNSGGPLFDMHGNVIGITTAKYSGMTSSGASVEGIGFAIPINDVIVLLDDLQTYGYVATRAYLGVNVQVNIPVGEHPDGAYISETIAGYCAEDAGVQGGDVIVALGEYEVGSYNDLVAALRHFSAGDTTEITVWRSGEYLTLPITLSARPHSEPAEQTQLPVETVDPFGFGFPFP